jgi:hypothetical protein
MNFVPLSMDNLKLTGQALGLVFQLKWLLHSC